MTLIPRQDASGPLGLKPTFQQATSTDTAVGGQCVHLLVNNASGSSVTVTLVTPEQVEGALAVGDRLVTVLTGSAPHEIPLPSRYNDPTGIANILFSATGATITVAAVQGSPTP